MADLTSTTGIMAIIKDAIDKYIREQGRPENVFTKVKRVLDGQLETMVYAALGLEKDGFGGGRYSVKSHSKLSEILGDEVDKAVAKWVAEGTQKLNLTVTPKMLASMKRNCQHTFERKISDAVNTRVEQQVQENADVIANALKTLPFAETIEKFQESIPPEKCQTGVNTEFKNMGVLKTCDVVALVRITDDGRITEVVDDPDKEDVRFLVNVTDKLLGHNMQIVVDGGKWQAAHIRHGDDGKIDPESSRLLEEFPLEDAAVFNLMGEADQALIAAKIDEFVKGEDEQEGG